VSATAAADAADGASSETSAVGEKRSRWAFLKLGFSKTRAGLKSLFRLRGKLDEATLEDIEAELYAADFGPAMVQELVDGEHGLRQAWKKGEIDRQEEVLGFLKTHLKGIRRERDSLLATSAAPPTVFLVAGVNGTGKTTSIAKIAYRLREEGSRVVLAAADTFRAAAVEQLTIWSERLGVEIVTGKPKADPASVAFAGAQRAREGGFDYLVVDTAGRLHTDKNLMRELQKIRAVLGKQIEGAPHESLLVLDATNGQNAIQQARAFKQDIDVTGIVLTKLDGTAKGGTVFAIHQELEIPVKLVGLGERLENLAPFDSDKFVDALFEENGAQPEG
jgi:fused signal recognition particle receptor